MKALYSTAPGGPDTLELTDVDAPSPGKGQLGVRVLACAINYPDVLIIEDLYQMRPPRPFAPGAEIAGAALPCVMHCSAGKDRTGMAAALVLSAVGVARDDVLDDYAMTDRVAASEDDMARSLFVGKDGGGRAQGAMREAFSAEAIAVMRLAKPEFLESAFAGIEREYGALGAYYDSIGVDDAMRERLVNLLVEPA